MLSAGRSPGELAAGAAAILAVVAHAAVRLKVKAGRVRRRPRGDIDHPRTFDRMIAVCFALLAGAVFEWLSGIWAIRWAVSAFGLACLLISAGLQWRAFHDLGGAYSPDIEVRLEQPLVRSGLYGRIRHPLLLALVLEVPGIALFLNAYATALLSAFVLSPVIGRRMRQEEAALIRHFGESYLLYRRQVGALVPRLPK